MKAINRWLLFGWGLLALQLGLLCVRWYFGGPYWFLVGCMGISAGALGVLYHVRRNLRKVLDA